MKSTLFLNKRSLSSCLPSLVLAVENPTVSDIGAFDDLWAPQNESTLGLLWLWAIFMPDSVSYRPTHIGHKSWVDFAACYWSHPNRHRPLGCKWHKDRILSAQLMERSPNHVSGTCLHIGTLKLSAPENILWFTRWRDQKFLRLLTAGSRKLPSRRD